MFLMLKQIYLEDFLALELLLELDLQEEVFLAEEVEHFFADDDLQEDLLQLLLLENCSTSIAQKYSS